jgi:hypothetical protein
MKEVRLDADASKQFGEHTCQALVCDSDGRVLGTFQPWPERPRVDELQLEPPSSIEEIEERRKNPTGKPLEEILARLGIQ